MITDLMAQGMAQAGDHLTILAQFDDVDPVAPPGEDRYQWLLGILKWFCMIGGVVAIMIGGAMAGYEKYFSHGEIQSPKKIAGAVIGGVVASTAGVLVSAAWGW